jgi:hypothetical protein
MPQIGHRKGCREISNVRLMAEEDAVDGLAASEAISIANSV